ncbi:multidrug DMT transporter permease [Pseudomonas cichorii]|nr:multidrug DMT transporter permease [Pseudomonas cichorii]
MDELRILIARLGWPSTSARWWTMQELAARLNEPDSRAETESVLLQLLSTRKLEAEVIEVLCIYWMAAQAYGYSPTPKLAESIPRSSILSDLLLESFSMFAECGDEELEEVPEEFEIPQDFDGVQGSDLPRIFRTSMGELENHTGLPFARQMAFEWTANRSAYPDAPFQRDPWHFLRPLGDGFVGQLSSRTALRAISAYLRTLAVAKEFWAMPTNRADERALLALPIHPTLALLRPRRPAWFPGTTDFDGNTEAIEASLRAMIDRVQAVRSGDELIAFSSPIVMSMERCVEVSIVRWSQAADSNIADADLAAYLEDFWIHGRMIPSVHPEPLSTTTLLVLPHLDGLMEEKSKAWPLAAPLGLDRIGYLQHDLYPGRLFLPTLPGSYQAELIPRNGQLEIKVNEQVVADLCYWNAGWGAARPMQFGGNCGTALTSRGTGYRERPALTEGTVRSFYLWQVKTLHRGNTFDRFSQTLTMGAMFV